ncbi:amidophosphoribosyltransferase-like [Schistocerca gregaria]|uniref:amidophosphoribosyltransferase-like n=1 Tax=Schistocerca gregaria TaxID=7010 RepID=UPI00211DB7CD|nr:amidophosphoribosyltransferase-like [Schistocerca gregaria]
MSIVIHCSHQEKKGGGVREETEFVDDKPREECGVFAVSAPEINVSKTAFFALFSLQHRGQDGAGIATSDGKNIHSHKDIGLVSHIFNKSVLKKLPGSLAIGHTRYSTTGALVLQNAQPFVIETVHGPVALAHNGQLSRGQMLRRELMARGIGMFTTSDSECIIQLIAEKPDLEEAGEPNWIARIQSFMDKVEGSYSCVMLTTHSVFAWRDRHGIRPLCLGKLSYSVSQSQESKNQHSLPFNHAHNNSTSADTNHTLKTDQVSGFDSCTNERFGWVVSSESCALNTIHAQFIRDILPGEIIQIDRDRLISTHSKSPPLRFSPCVFEYVYFARPDSIMNGRLIYSVRHNLGRQLAIEGPVPSNADIVIGIPDSSTPIAIGYAQQSGIAYMEGLIKNRYIARTFIQPDPNMRVASVSLKYNPLAANLKGKAVILVDDSIVRGTTCQQIVQLVRSAGAREVHVRVASPPIKYPCYMGVDMKTKNELIASKYSIPEIIKHLRVDSLGYLSQEGMEHAILNSVTEKQEQYKTFDGHFCSACFTGEYPVEVEPW